MEQFIEPLHKNKKKNYSLHLCLMICLAHIVWLTGNKEEKQLNFIQNEQKYAIWWRC